MGRLAIGSVIAPTAVQIGVLNLLVGVEAKLRVRSHRGIDLLPEISVFIVLCTRTPREKLVILGPALH